MNWLLAAALLAPSAYSRAAESAKPSDGTALSVMSTTQGNFGKLGIGAGFMGGGPYLDEKEVRREGLHASLAITVAGDPAHFRQADAREGQTLEVAGYRILIEKINPGAKGSVVLRLWAPPKPVKAPKRWPFSLFGS